MQTTKYLQTAVAAIVTELCISLFSFFPSYLPFFSFLSSFSFFLFFFSFFSFWRKQLILYCELYN